ncbi:IS3 family transposase [Ligilactobacillus acidipiscis]|uniref:IS3 family transposase n=1 Tax=Ligilactobacillus acidipiscis TaxID=89059 RepID=UPI003D79D0EF
MSRKGNCLDNAPIESLFNLLKRESLNRCKIWNIEELNLITEDCVQWFNDQRISLKTTGLSPVEYRKQVLGS